ncbi:zinc finger 395 [Pelobates cultripes]|uniref:Zinc finger 395 n=1 Tax=Pelobates cultripes TaxID=61616 RepID=A0AAD1R9I8_PELCU|nr:zinc finger 395 [Pelobates cultripes]
MESVAGVVLRSRTFSKTSPLQAQTTEILNRRKESPRYDIGRGARQYSDSDGPNVSEISEVRGQAKTENTGTQRHLGYIISRGSARSEHAHGGRVARGGRAANERRRAEHVGSLFTTKRSESRSCNPAGRRRRHPVTSQHSARHVAATGNPATRDGSIERPHTRDPVAMASMLSKRLGKRSLLGARVCTPSLSPDGMLVEGPLAVQADLSGGANLCPYEGGCYKECPEEAGTSMTNLPSNRFKLYPGQRVCITHNGKECVGLVEQHNHVDDEVKLFVLELGLHLCRKMEDVRLADIQKSVPYPVEHTIPANLGATSSTTPRSVSRSIDVPKRRSDAVEMDEMMAAMVLTSLSCSPIVQSPPCSDTIPAPRVTCDLWKESGDVSDSGSSTTSGHWSAGSGVSTPSPPHTEASPKYTSEVFSTSHMDEGFETDPDPFILDEPAPRKRKNSVKVMYKCLWPNCGKLLRSIVGIKRHVKTQHLGDGADSDQRKREEDFYYTEVQMKEEVEAESTPRSPNTATAPILIQPVLPKPETPALEVPSVESPLPSALSQSAPGSFWHIQADHAYQAMPSIQIPVSPHIFTSISWAAAPSSIPALSPVSIVCLTPKMFSP